MMVTFYWSTMDCKALMRVFAHWVLAGLHWLIVKTWKLTMTCRQNFFNILTYVSVCVYDLLNWGCVWCGRPSGGDKSFHLMAFMTSLTLSRSVKWTSTSQSETRKLKENGTDWETRKSSGHFWTMVIKFQGAWNAAWKPSKSRWSKVRLERILCHWDLTWLDHTVGLEAARFIGKWGFHTVFTRGQVFVLATSLQLGCSGKSSIKVERYNHLWFWLKLQAARIADSCEQRLVNRAQYLIYQ